MESMEIDSQQPTSTEDNNQAFVDQLSANEKLRIFYQRFFPYKPYYHWLNYETSPTKAFLNREFSFTLPNDVYVRYQSFKDAEELKNELLKEVPAKIDIGAVYTMRPKDKKFSPPNSFKPIMKELVIDIDLTDYDDVRQCCSKADICLKCWQFITVAIVIIDKTLRGKLYDFGFKHLLWVYSGRRGVHCWICDDRARKLDNDGRKAIISYLAMIKGGSQQEKKVFLSRPFHPSLERAYRIVDHYFTVLALENQDVMDTPERWTKLLKCIPEEAIRDVLNEKWETTPSRDSTLKWDDLMQALQNAVYLPGKNISKEVASKRAEALETIKREIQFQYIYPRLDENVSAHINHLLKSPFCIHPSTGRVCVPIPPDDFENFDPTKVPTVSTIIYEMSQWNERHPVQSGERKMSDYEKTSLKPYVKYFEDFVQEVLKDARIRRRAAQQRTMEF
ncbi:12896_t:CDS:10 [Ambispora gerdemannii]|uniref:DNA primase n=1 Tax=Ambispora gerdemannii TaxID=144530 RepID=A0A9N8YMY3_9GLOM|nr:12896_t:CDS:10 [Ambispora gerdemannii]